MSSFLLPCPNTRSDLQKRVKYIFDGRRFQGVKTAWSAPGADKTLLPRRKKPKSRKAVQSLLLAAHPLSTVFLRSMYCHAPTLIVPHIELNGIVPLALKN